jgi:hypothetical protein
LLANYGKAAGIAPDLVPLLISLGPAGVVRSTGDRDFLDFWHHLTGVRDAAHAEFTPGDATSDAVGRILGGFQSTPPRAAQSGIAAVIRAAQAEKGTPEPGAGAGPPTQAGEEEKEASSTQGEEEVEGVDVDAILERIAKARDAGANEEQLDAIRARGAEQIAAGAGEGADRIRRIIRGAGIAIGGAGVAGAAGAGGLAAWGAIRDALIEAGMSEENAEKLKRIIRREPGHASTIKTTPEGEKGPSPSNPDQKKMPGLEGITREPLLRPEFMQDNATIVEESVEQQISDVVEYENFDAELRRPPEASGENPLWNDVMTQTAIRFSGDLQMIRHTHFGTGEGEIGAIVPHINITSGYDRDKRGATWEFERPKPTVMGSNSVPPIVSYNSAIPSDTRSNEFNRDYITPSYFKVRPSEVPARGVPENPFFFSNVPLPTVFKPLFPTEQLAPFNDVAPNDTWEAERRAEQPLLIQPIYH